MKYKIEELNDITDSREILQSTPKGFSRYMTYIILALVTVIMIWSIFAHKEISVKVSGVVRPSDEVNTVSSSIMGNITSLNIKDGDEVKEGDTLLIVNGEEYVLQRDILQETIDKKKKELEGLQIFKKSILEKNNYFDLNDDIQASYYKQYELFLNNLNNNENQQESINTQREKLNNNIRDLEKLKASIEEGKNSFQEGVTYYYQYKDYEIVVNKYNNIIENDKRRIEDLKKSVIDVNKESVEEEILQLNNNILSAQKDLEQYKNTTKINITSKIDEYKMNLSSILNSSAAGNYTEQYIANLESKISVIESSISDTELQLETVKKKVDDTSIKATASGIINMISDVKVGDYLQSGLRIATIVPSDNSQFNLQLYIDNQNLGSVREGNDVVIELASLPGGEYGYLHSTINKISADVKADEKRDITYYTADCKINETALKNKKGESTDIKNGMIAQARIVNRKVSYFRYFLEKLDIL